MIHHLRRHGTPSPVSSRVKARKDARQTLLHSLEQVLVLSSRLAGVAVSATCPGSQL